MAPGMYISEPVLPVPDDILSCTTCSGSRRLLKSSKLPCCSNFYLEEGILTSNSPQRIVKSWSTDVQTSAEPRYSAATLEANRLRRSRRSKTQIAPPDEAQVLGEALGDLRLNGDQGEAEGKGEKMKRESNSNDQLTGRRMAAVHDLLRPNEDNAAVSKKQAKAAQRLAQKATRKNARKRRFGETTQNLLRQHELDPSVKMSKNKKKGVLRLQMEQKSRLGKGKYPQSAHERPNQNPIKPTKREKYRRLVITPNGVELEPRGIDRYVPDDGPSDDESRQPRLLRSNYRAPGRTPTNSCDLGYTHGDGAQLESRAHDRYVPDYGPSSSIDPPPRSRYSLRRSHEIIGDIHTKNGEKIGPFGESTSEGRIVVEDAEWMDIDDISFRTAGVHLA